MRLIAGNSHFRIIVSWFIKNMFCEYGPWCATIGNYGNKQEHTRNYWCNLNRIRIHYSIMCCSINSVSSVHTENSKKKKHLNNRKKIVWNVEHFMHSTDAVLITLQRGGGAIRLLMTK